MCIYLVLNISLQLQELGFAQIQLQDCSHKVSLFVPSARMKKSKSNRKTKQQARQTRENLLTKKKRTAKSKF